MDTISKRFTFSASHQLTTLPERHQRRRPHGHNYEVEVELTGAELDEHGFVLDYGELAPVRRLVDELLDHRHLNDVLDVSPSPDALRTLVGSGRAVFRFVAEQPGDLDEVAAMVEQYDLRHVWISPKGTTPRP